MRSTSNQSSDGGSYSDLIHGDQGNTYTTTTTTSTTTSSAMFYPYQGAIVLELTIL